MSFDDPTSAAAGGFVVTTVTLPDDLAKGKTFNPTDDAKSLYGKALSKALFQDPAFLTFYSVSRGKASDGILRVRLFFSANADELHNLRWELMHDPVADEVLSAGANVLFSRFVSSSQWKPIHLRQKSRLRALIVVSNPPDLDEGFKAVDVRGETVRAWLALAGKPVPVTLDAEWAAVPLEELAEKLGAGTSPFGEMASISVLGLKAGEFASVDNILRALRGGVDILYLVCHGVLANRPFLYLQGADGKRVLADGISFANDMRALAEPPSLVVLASCESASAGPDGLSAEAALAPLLADAGVPAIVAMRAQITMDTIALIMPEFFGEVVRHGQIDRAMATARRKAFRNKRFDAWMPALFLRLKSGSLWYEPGFGGDSAEETTAWKAICTAVQNKALVPILGQDLAEHVYGSTADLTAKLAEVHNIPRLMAQKPESAKITQAVETKLGREALHSSLNQLILQRLLATATRLSPVPLRTPTAERPFTEAELLNVVIDALAKNPDDPFTILAGLDVKVYVSAAIDTLLKRFLRRNGKVPYEVCVDWRNEANNGFERIQAAANEVLAAFVAAPSASANDVLTNWEKASLEKENMSVPPAPKPGEAPSAAVPALELPLGLRVIRDSLLERLREKPEGVPPLEVVRAWRDALQEPPGDIKSNQWPVKTPILYYVYGKKSYPGSLVLTEDDFFEYLIQYSKYNLMPGMISSSMVEGSLLFLGFSLDDWKFRILFRNIMNKAGAELLKRKAYKHVGVQLDPDDYTPAEAIRMKQLLMEYFSASKISIYWGSSADFLRELRGHLTAPREVVIESDT